MKRKIFSIMAIAAIALTSCKKDEPATSELGEATINGNVWADMDQTDSDVEGVSGMAVKVEVWTGDWVQNTVGGYDYDTKVFTTTTDANGDYTLVIPATEEGYNITIEFEDLYTTVTADNGVQDVKVTRNNIGKYIYSGAMISTKDEATINVISAGANAYGEATVTGNIYFENDYAGWNGFDGWELFTTTNGMTANSVKWIYDNGDAPYNNGDQTVRSVDVDMTAGTYTLTIPTEALGQNDVYAYWGMLDFTGSGTINNVAGTADSTVNGYYSTGGSGIYEDGTWLEDSEIYTQDIYISFNQF